MDRSIIIFRVQFWLINRWVDGLRLFPQKLGNGEFFLLFKLAFKVDGFVGLFGYFELVLRSLEVGLQAV